MTLRRGWLQGNSGVRQLPSWRLFKARFQHFSVLMGRRDILLPLRQSQVNANQVVFVETVHKHSAVTTLNWKLQLQSEMDMFHCWSQFLQNVLCGGFLSLTRIRSEKFFLIDLPKSWLLGEFKINYPKIYTWSIKKKWRHFFTVLFLTKHELHQTVRAASKASSYSVHQLCMSVPRPITLTECIKQIVLCYVCAVNGMKRVCGHQSYTEVDICGLMCSPAVLSQPCSTVLS